MTRNDLPSFDLGTYVVSICFDPHGELGPGTGSSNDFGAMDFAEAGCYCGRPQCTDCALSAVSTQSNLQSQITAALQNLASSHNELAWISWKSLLSGSWILSRGSCSPKKVTIGTWFKVLWSLAKNKWWLEWTCQHLSSADFRAMTRPY